MTSQLRSTACALLLGVLPVLAQNAPPAPAGQPQRPVRERMEAKVAARLKLTEAQQASIKEIRTKHQQALAGKRKAAMEAQTALHQAMAKPEAKPEELKALHRTAADLEFELRLDQRTLHQEIRALLTPEQREQSARMEGRMEGMRMGHHGHGPHREAMGGGQGR